MNKSLGRILLVLAAAVVALVGLWLLWAGPGPARAPLTVEIARGSSLVSAARQLEAAGAIADAGRFRILVRLLGSDEPIKAGEYEIPAGASASDVLSLLQRGRTLIRLVTIPEGMPSVLVAEKLMDEPLLTGTVRVPREGAVLPDSYSFERGEARAAVLGRMQDAMAKTLAELWARRKPTSVVRTPEEAIILASIVEKETALASERRTVAGVYSNRVRIGMPLQADPTVIYPITKGKPLGRRIRQSELRDDNGYNTYARAGLPDGPIANPGRDSIAAVLDPQPTNALYFVADGKGGHVFAETLAEHQANVAKWYAIRRSRGEM